MWKSTPPKKPSRQTADELRGQNGSPGDVPTANWDGTNPGKQPLLGTNRDPNQGA